MTLAERLADAQQRSVAIYLQRMDLETQRQAIQAQAASADRALLAIDGEIQLLTALIAEQPTPKA